MGRKLYEYQSNRNNHMKKISIAKPIIENDDLKAVNDVLKSGNLASGVKVKEFEEKFAKYNGNKFAIATSSGTTALCTALKMLNITGDVITTPFTFIATANSIKYAGAKPVFADIYPDTFNIDVDAIQDKITNTTEAILVVHLFGQACEMKPIVDLCKDYKLKLIEDCCQAHGATCYNRKVGTFGEAGVFSFYPTKNMTTGEGGMIVTDSERLTLSCRQYINHGTLEKYYHTNYGLNYRMTDVEAALGISQLKKLDKWNEIRNRNARILTKKLRYTANIIPQRKTTKRITSVYNQFTVRCLAGRDNIQKKLNSNNIGTSVYYPTPIHLQPCYGKYNTLETRWNSVKTGFFPNAEQIAEEVLSIPVHPGVTTDDANRIANVIIKADDAKTTT